MRATLGFAVAPAPAVTAPMAANPEPRRNRDASTAASKAENAENIIRFALWMAKRKTYPSFHEVIETFGVHRSTAHRMLNAYEAVTGIERPRNPGGER